MVSAKHFCLRNQQSGAVSALLFEVRLEVRDNRSGYAGSAVEAFAAPLLADAELEWTRDMVERVDVSQLVERPEPSPLEWPEMADNKLIRYLVHFYRREIWVNTDLQVYSEPTESREDFITRCLQLLVPERRRELEMIRDVYLRRFLDLERRGREAVSAEEWSDSQPFSQLSQVQDAFSRIREDFSCCFLGEDFALLPPERLRWDGFGVIEIEERLQHVRQEFIRRFNDITRTFVQRAQRVEPYEVPVSPAHIDIVSRSFLWA